MAITVLSSGISPITVNGSLVSASVPLIAGSNRMLVSTLLFVGNAPAGTIFITSRYNSVVMNRMSDGVTSATVGLSSSDSLTHCRVATSMLREADLPAAAGSYPLDINYFTGTGSTPYPVSQAMLAWRLLNGVQQPSNPAINAAGVAIASSASTATTAILAVFPAGAVGDALLTAGLKRDTTNAPSHVYAGIGTVPNEFDVSVASFLTRMSGASSMAAPSAGTINATMSFGATPANPQCSAMTAVRLRPFVAPIPGDVTMMLNEPWSVDVGWMP